MSTVAAYLRVSSRPSARDADGKPRQTTASQASAVKTYCAAHGLKPRTYEDYATGRNVRRPALQRLLQDCASGTVKHLIVTDLSRLSRSIKDALALLETLSRQGVRLTLLNQGLDFDPTSAVSRFTLQIFGALAELESSIRSERVRNGLQLRRAKGLPCGRGRDQQKRAKVATLRQQGTSVRDIARALGVTRQSVYRLLSA